MKQRLKIKQGGEAQAPARASYKYLSMKSRALLTLLGDLHREELLHPPQEWVNRSRAQRQGNSRLENLPDLSEKHLCCLLPGERDR